MKISLVLWVSSFVLAAWLSGCAIVPRYQREALANPAMDPRATLLEEVSVNKLHSSREVAAGGNGRPAGGGCACGN